MASTNPELLLDHGPFLRGIATALLHDRDDADDVVQTAYELALAKPPRDGWPLPQWLAGVTRNLARRSRRERGRRAAREHAVAGTGVARPTDEVVQREELRREVVAAVLALEEPCRSVVLLRYYDGLPPREIAVRMGMPPATVRSHLHRAHDRLRQRLDREQREDRDAWRTLLLPLVHGDTASVAAPQRVRWTWFVAGCCAVAAVAVMARPWFEPVAPAVATSADAARLPPLERVPAAAREPAREEVPGPVAADPVVPPLPAVHLRFIGSDGLTVGGAALRTQFDGSGTAPTVLAVSDEQLTGGGIGRALATLAGEQTAWTRPCVGEFVDDGEIVRDLPVGGRHRLLVARPGAAPFLSPTLVLPLTDDVTFDVLLPPAASMRSVRIVDRETHDVLAGAAVRIYVEFGDDSAYVPVTTVRANENGECRLSTDVPRNPGVIRPPTFWVETATHSGRFQLKDGTDVQEVPVPTRGRVEGIAFDLDAQPAATRTVVFVASKGPSTRVVCDAQGRFAVDGVPAGRTLVVLDAADPSDCVVAQAAVKPGATLTLTVGSATPGAVVTGRVTAGGAPVGGVAVMFAGRGDGRRLATTRADGTYRLRGIAGEGSLLLVCGEATVSDNFGAREIERQAPAAGSAHVVDFDLPPGIVRVRVLDETTGDPIAGAALHAIPANAEALADRFPGFRFAPGWAARSEADGSATMRSLPLGPGVTLRVGGPGFVTRSLDVPASAPDAASPPVEVRISRSE